MRSQKRSSLPETPPDCSTTATSQFVTLSSQTRRPNSLTVPRTRPGDSLSGSMQNSDISTISDERTREGFTPPVATPLIGVSPDPAAALSYSMSHPPAQQDASYERSHLVGGNLSTEVMNSPSTLAVRDAEPLPSLKLLLVPPAVSESGESSSAATQKRKRGQLQDCPADNYESPESQKDVGPNDLVHESKKLVTPTDSLQSANRNHACDECGAVFTLQHNLKRHERQHTREKPFACANCSCRFARADELSRHAKSSGKGGCVNNRRTSRRLNSAQQAGGNYQSPSPVTASDGNDEFPPTSFGGAYPRKGSAGSLAGSDRHVQSPRRLEIQQVQHDRDSGYATSDNRGSYEPPDRPTYEHSAPTPGVHNGAARSSEPRSILPPLQTGFPFGVSSVFDGSRRPAAHPLSNVRGDVLESAPARGQSLGASFAEPTTVSISQVQQSEAQHHEVEERLRQPESHSNVPRTGQEEQPSTKEEDRCTASSSSV